MQKLRSNYYSFLDYVRSLSTKFSLLYSFFLILGIILFLINTYKALQNSYTGSPLFDFIIFRESGENFLNGNDLYQLIRTPPNPNPDFNFGLVYPPFAALIFTLFTIGSTSFAQCMWTISNLIFMLLIILGTLYRTDRYKKGTFFSLQAILETLALSGFLFITWPIDNQFNLGQVTLFLSFLITIDILGFTPKKLRGIAIGIAAAIKITPLFFIIFYVFKRDWMSCIRIISTLLITIIVFIPFNFLGTIYYWTEGFFSVSSQRAGWLFNQSALGIVGSILPRGYNNILTELLSKATTIIILLITMYCIYKLLKRNYIVEALGIAFMGLTLSSPISAPNHWAGAITIFVLILSTQINSFRYIAFLQGVSWIFSYFRDYVQVPSDSLYYLFENNFISWFYVYFLAISNLCIFIAFVLVLIKLPYSTVKEDLKEIKELLLSAIPRRT